MKLYKRTDFIKLPKNTIYSRVDINSANLCDGLFCKTSNNEDWHNDFIEQDLISESGYPLCSDYVPDKEKNTDGFDNHQHQLNLRDTFKEFTTDLHCSGRDGLYDDVDLFVVWDKYDVKKLIEYLQNTLK